MFFLFFFTSNMLSTNELLKGVFSNLYPEDQYLRRSIKICLTYSFNQIKERKKPIPKAFHYHSTLKTYDSLLCHTIFPLFTQYILVVRANTTYFEQSLFLEYDIIGSVSANREPCISQGVQHNLSSFNTSKACWWFIFLSLMDNDNDNDNFIS